MEITFKLELKEFIIQQNNYNNLTKRQFIISSIMTLDKSWIDDGYIKYGKELEKIFNYQNENAINTESVCHIYAGDDVNETYFTIQNEYCKFSSHLSQDKLLKLHKQLMLDSNKYQTNIKIGITITDSEEIKIEGNCYIIKVSEYHFYTENIE